MSNIKLVLGTNIKMLRKELGWRRVRLAELTDLTPTFLFHIENGTRGVSLETVDTIARCLGVSVPRLFEPIAEEALAEIEERETPERILEREIQEAVQAAVKRYVSSEAFLEPEEAALASEAQ